MSKTLLFLAIILMSSGCAFQRIGDLTMISNRNVDADKEYFLIKRNVEGKAKMKNNDALELAVDNATSTCDGEFMKNVIVFVKSNGRNTKVKVVGDVWGDKNTHVNVKSYVTKEIHYETGDKVAFNSSGKIILGTIIGINDNGAIVEYENSLKQTKSKQIPFEEITKIDY